MKLGDGGKRKGGWRVKTRRKEMREGGRGGGQGRRVFAQIQV